MFRQTALTYNNRHNNHAETATKHRREIEIESKIRFGDGPRWLQEKGQGKIQGNQRKITRLSDPCMSLRRL